MNTGVMAPPNQPVTATHSSPRERFYRHRLPVRLMHWVNAICFVILLMSGLTIFNAHPNLYWGKDSTFDKPWLAIGAVDGKTGPVGVTHVAGRPFNTDGVLGASVVGSEDSKTARAFPSWSTIPGPQWLTMGRHWHFFFAWIFVINGVGYLLWTIVSGHLRRDLVPTGGQVRSIGRSIKDHLLFRHPTGAAAKRYNVLQIITYLVVMFGLLPLIVVAGMAMSPRLDSVFTGWIDIFGGRQSARSIHFLAAAGLVLFLLVHVFEVLISGPWNELRSMVTGWFVVPADKHGSGK